LDLKEWLKYVINIEDTRAWKKYIKKIELTIVIPTHIHLPPT